MPRNWLNDKQIGICLAKPDEGECLWKNCHFNYEASIEIGNTYKSDDLVETYRDEYYLQLIQDERLAKTKSCIKIEKKMIKYKLIAMISDVLNLNA